MSICFCLTWLLAITKSFALLVSLVVKKPNTELTSDANDFVTGESQACKKEICSHRLVQR